MRVWSLAKKELRLLVRDRVPAVVKVGERLLKDRRVRLARSFDKDLDATLRKLEARLRTFGPLAKRERVQLTELIELAAGKDRRKSAEFRAKVGDGVQGALKKQFSKYDLTGMTWAALTRSPAGGSTAQVTTYVNREGSGLLK